jgi:thimet oligopeptidase
MKLFQILVLAMTITLLPTVGSAADKSSSIDTNPFWASKPDAEAFTKMMTERLDLARKALDEISGFKGRRTIENTLSLYDKVLINLDVVSSQASLMEAVHPDAKVREAAEKMTQQASAFYTELSLNRAVYDALNSLDISKADPETRYYVQRDLRDFRLAGVDKDEATRKRIKELRDELVVIGQEFDRNIRSDVRTVTVDSAAELDGLPADYIANHKPDANGKITLTTDYPDSLPIFSYAKNEDLRKRMYIAYNNRAYPKNMQVLDRMIARRYELATLLGYPHWADYITANKMVGSGRNAADFIDRVVDASGDKAAREYGVLLKRKQQDMSGATTVNAWETSYYSELVRKSNYDFDSQTVRPYFPYDRVKQGLFDVTSKLFGVTYRHVKDVPVWDPSVEAFELLENGKLVGRFYLDMHPRENKYKHAAQFNIRTGVAGTQIPEAALICNLPGGEPGDPGLMSHDDVVTFFHEFGHLVHALLGGRHRWVGVGGNNTEQDFVEAPSQMLEEWTWDPATLATFARHYKTNEPIPVNLVKQMKRANEFGKALAVRRQMVYAKLSLSIYDRDPKQVNTDDMVKALVAKYQPFPFADGTHFQTAFGHLDGYSAVYYTYMWSLVIAKDLFSQFDKSNLLAPATAKRYRETILAAGASKPAAAMVQDFMGRPFDFKAWQEWLNEGE